MKAHQFMLCAPFPGMDIPWTDEKKLEFERVLEQYEAKPQTKTYKEYEVDFGKSTLDIYIPIENSIFFSTSVNEMSKPFNLVEFKTLVKSLAGRII